jgi:tRNA pseudouridine38-40 synthase
MGDHVPTPIPPHAQTGRTRRLRLLLEYDGTRFSGFQRQPGRPTVQAALEEGLSAVCGHAVSVTGAGRTDAGVHALGQVVHFDTTGRIPAERVAEAVNARVDPELVVREAQEAPAGFHARFHAASRTYFYFVTKEQPSPFAAPYVMHERHLAPDALERMQAALPALLGKHDFAAFCAAGIAARTTERTVTEAVLRERWPLLRLELTADAFLHNMVRIIAGVLLEIGRGRRHPEAVRTALESRSREEAAQTAPPQGLFLARVQYPDGYPPEDRYRDWWPCG